MTENELSDICDDLVKIGDIAAAFDTCNQFVSNNPRSAKGFRKRAALYARQDDFGEAIKDMDEAIRLSPDEASYYFFRGWWKLENGDFADAETDQSSAIEKEHSKGEAFVSESAYFFRSLARLRLRKFDEALSDSERVGDGFLIYLKSIGKITKSELVERLHSS